MNVLIDLGFEARVVPHRWIGRLTVLLAALHCALQVPNWLAGAPLLTTTNLFGTIALLFGLSLVLTSLPFVRRAHYNWFLIAHFAFVGWFVAGMLHASIVLYFSIAALAIYFIDRVLRV